MTEYFKIMQGAFLLPEPRQSKIKFVGFDKRGDLVTKESPEFPEELVFNCKGDLESLNKIMNETIKKFGVTKVIWRLQPVTLYDTVSKETWAEAICYFIIEGSVNAENPFDI